MLFFSSPNTRNLTKIRRRIKEDFPTSKLRKYLWMTLGVVMVLSMTILVMATPVSESFDGNNQPSYTAWTYNGFSAVNSICGSQNACAGYAVRFQRAQSGVAPSPTPSLEYIGTGASPHGKDGGTGTIKFDYEVECYDCFCRENLCEHWRCSL